MTGGPAETLPGLDVSRETLARLAQYSELVRKWTRSINLIAPGSMTDIWQRHIVDSAQLFTHVPNDARKWIDLGSGGGFPGMVVAILAQEPMPELVVTLIESDHRKSAFLRAAARETGVRVRIHAERIESVQPLNADVVSARALAPLPRLLGLVQRHLAPSGAALLSKGEGAANEVAEARKEWSFSLEQFESKTDARACVLKIGDLSRV